MDLVGEDVLDAFWVASLGLSCLITLLFLTMSTGTGLISTFPMPLLDGGSLVGLFLGPQVISFEHLMTYGYFLPETSTFSRNLSSKFFTPEFLAIRASSSSFLCLTNAYWRFLEEGWSFFWLLERLPMNELSRVLKMLLRERFRSMLLRLGVDG
jgi:hypothetical protein